MPALGAVAAFLRRCFVAERDRWILWLPVAFGAGIGVYFVLPAEPVWWSGPTVCAISAAGLLFFRRRLAALLLCSALFSGALGFGAAQWRTVMVAAPVLAERTGPVWVEGRIRRVSLRQTGVRVLLDDVRIAGIKAAETPERVRISLRREGDELRPGVRIRAKAFLLPPPGPAVPGAFDFQRRAYFKRLGAVGWAAGMPEILQEAPPNWTDGLIERVRHSVTRRILAALPGESGGIAAALLTGERGRISEPTLAAMRDAGLAHLLAISGLHVGMVMLMFLGVFRFAFALTPILALRTDPKKWAAVAALMAGFGYVLLSGATVPTLRAFTMFAAAMTGLLIDREGLSLRMVAFAALLILALAPESLLQASFQMSFAAAIALIAAYEAWQARRARRPLERRNGLLGRGARGTAAVAFTTVVASLATAPFAVFHFNRLALYGLAANMAAVPMTAFWILPWGIAALLAMPVGLEQYPLVLMGAGIDFMVGIARTVAGWPSSVALVPPFAGWGLALLALGGLWLAVWRRGWRFAGVPLILLGLMSGGWRSPPDVLVSADGDLVAVRGPAGQLLLSEEARGDFTSDIWLRRSGQEGATAWPDAGGTAAGHLRCDALGCIYRRHDTTAAIVRDPLALRDDCRRASLVIVRGYMRVHCPSAERIIDRFELWRNGSHAIWLSETGNLRVVDARTARGNRPWVLDPYLLRRERRAARSDRSEAKEKGKGPERRAD